MGKPDSSRIADHKKWLKKNAEAGLNLKPAQAALASAEKAITELAALRARLKDTIALRKTASLSLTEAMQKVKTEKRLKAKEARLQAKIASLAAPPPSK